jgi:hypothetical protein
MKSSLKLLAVLAFVGLLCITPSAFAATTFTASIENLEALPGLGFTSGVFSFNVEMNVSDNFEFDNFQRGGAIPTGAILGWANSPEPGILDGKFRYGAFSQDKLFLDTDDPLQNGILFSFDYDGTNDDVSAGEPVLSEFLAENANGDRVNLHAIGVLLITEFTEDTLTYAVPIPSAIFLLGGGLISLLAVRRRRS